MWIKSEAERESSQNSQYKRNLKEDMQWEAFSQQNGEEVERIYPLIQNLATKGTKFKTTWINILTKIISTRWPSEKEPPSSLCLLILISGLNYNWLRENSIVNVMQVGLNLLLQHFIQLLLTPFSFPLNI